MFKNITITQANISNLGKFKNWKYDDWSYNVNLPDNTEDEVQKNFCDNANIDNLNLNVLPKIYNEYCFYYSTIKKINNKNWNEVFLNTTLISQYAFSNINFNDNNPTKSIVFNKSATLNRYSLHKITVDEIKILNAAVSKSLILYADCFNYSSIKKIEVEKVDYIETDAFKSCTGLQEIKICWRQMNTSII